MLQKPRLCSRSICDLREMQLNREGCIIFLILWIMPENEQGRHGIVVLFRNFKYTCLENMVAFNKFSKIL